jgi:cephalosporin-C deacetylase
MTGLEPYPPEGFEEFWAETVAESGGAPLDFTQGPAVRESAFGHEVRTFSFRGVSGGTLHGWFALGGEGAPGFLWVPPYGQWSMPPDQYGTRPGFTSASLNFFGHGAFHSEEYKPERGYFAQGIGDPRTHVFRRMFQDAHLALRVLAASGHADPGRLGVAGLSQGGGMAVWLGAWVPGLRAVVADYPFLSGMPWVFSRGLGRYPLREVADWADGPGGSLEQAGRTFAFFDTVNQAAHCRVPTQVCAGLRDPAVRPEQARAVYGALPGEKELVEIDFGHDWHPSMVERNQAWLERWLG